MNALYWLKVKYCLIEFHRLAPREAEASVKQAMHLMSDLTANEQQLAEHIDPFQTACDLADTQLELEPYFEQYKNLIAIAQTKIDKLTTELDSYKKRFGQVSQPKRNRPKFDSTANLTADELQDYLDARKSKRAATSAKAKGIGIGGERLVREREEAQSATSKAKRKSKSKK